jgi:hypothetical protein
MGRVEMLAQQHWIRQKRDDGGVKKTLEAFIHRADERTISRLSVEASILLAGSRGNRPSQGSSHRLQSGYRRHHPKFSKSSPPRRRPGRHHNY